MPNRILKESICESDGLSNCSIFAQDLYKRLITYADDYGRFNADTQIMLARLYPRELDCVTQWDIIDALTELAGVGKVQFYTSSTREEVYGAFPNWAAHQRVRDSKHKCPEPDDTEINDWYLRRFIPLDMRVAIIERDKFKCQICGKFVTVCPDAKRLVKHGDGMYHIDHIVPVSQGGRASLENLRLTCPHCNLTRKKKFDFHDILAFAKNPRDSDRVSENYGNLPRVAESSRYNPIQSNPNPNPNPNPNCASAREREFEDEFEELWKLYPRKQGKDKAKTAYLKARKDGTSMEQVKKGVEAYAEYCQIRQTEEQYIKQGSTWFNQHCWGDEYHVEAPASGRNAVPMGATGNLGAAELEAIQQLLAEEKPGEDDNLPF